METEEVLIPQLTGPPVACTRRLVSRRFPVAGKRCCESGGPLSCERPIVNPARTHGFARDLPFRCSDRLLSWAACPECPPSPWLKHHHCPGLAPFGAPSEGWSWACTFLARHVTTPHCSREFDVHRHRQFQLDADREFVDQPTTSIDAAHENVKHIGGELHVPSRTEARCHEAAPPWNSRRTTQTSTVGMNGARR